MKKITRALCCCAMEMRVNGSERGDIKNDSFSTFFHLLIPLKYKTSFFSIWNKKFWKKNSIRKMRKNGMAANRRYFHGMRKFQIFRVDRGNVSRRCSIFHLLTFHPRVHFRWFALIVRQKKLLISRICLKFTEQGKNCSSMMIL